MVKRVIVLGGGSAGFLAAITLKSKSPNLDVVVIRSKEIGIIGVGEGSTFGFPRYLHGYLRIEPAGFYKVAQPSWKLGLRFTKWGPRPQFHYSFAPAMNARWNNLQKFAGYYCDEDCEYANMNLGLMAEDRVFVRKQDGSPQITHDFAYHIENRFFVDFLEMHAEKLNLKVQDDTVERVLQDENGVSGLVLRSGQTATADLYVDASGFQSVLLGKTLNVPFVSYKKTLYCDRAVVGGWERTDEILKPYTTCETMTTGWCWQIEHEDRINRGYVYSSSFISDEDAEKEFRHNNPKVESARVVKFISGRYERFWEKNVVGIGNSSAFVEPLEATSLGEICDMSHYLLDTLVDSDMDPTPTHIKHYNKRAAIKWDNIRRFLSVHYKYNTTYDNDFWRDVRQNVDLAGAEELVEYYMENGPSTHAKLNLLTHHDQFGMEGYLSLLVGQKVPYKKKYIPPKWEADLWNEIRTHIKAKSRAGYTVKEALQLFRSPNWKFGPEFMNYR